MDLTRPVTYRNYQLNSPSITDEVITGCQIDSINFANVESVGYREKRSASDGLDASDVYLAGRTVQMRGTLYGSNKAALFDELAKFRAAMSPTAAYLESPGDLGYLPFNFDVPTEDTVNWTNGYIPEMMRLRPYGTPAYVIDRDHSGGVSSLPYSIDWSAVMEARDPRIYAQDEVITFFDVDGTDTDGSGVVVNRGAYPAPLMIQLFFPAATTNERIVTLTAFGQVMTLTVPASTNDRTLRYNGAERTVHLTELGVEVLRMDLLQLAGTEQHPTVPAGSSSYSWTCRNSTNDARAITSTSQFWFWEAWS